MGNIVNKGLKLWILPDEDMIRVLNQNMGNAREGESTSQQQVFRDLAKSFNRFFNGISNYPKFKSKRNPK